MKIEKQKTEGDQPYIHSGRTVRYMVVVSDTHCGDKMGLIHKNGIINGEGRYLPGVTQLAMYSWWREFWDEFVPNVTRGERYDVLHNGDIIDNEHHHTKSLISNDISIQQKIAWDVMKPVVFNEKCRKYYQVSGTPVHDGESAEMVESIAKDLGAVPDSAHKHARGELWYQLMGPSEDGLVHALHHIGTAGSAQYETSALMREIAEEYIEAARLGAKPPFFVVRSHRHRYCEAPLMFYGGRARCIVTPGWQGKTPFAYKIAGGRVTQPQFGGVVLCNGVEELYHRTFWKHLDRPEVER
jgi:hypothetical protein